MYLQKVKNVPRNAPAKGKTKFPGAHLQRVKKKKHTHKNTQPPPPKKKKNQNQKQNKTNKQTLVLSKHTQMVTYPILQICTTGDRS